MEEHRPAYVFAGALAEDIQEIARWMADSRAAAVEAEAAMLAVNVHDNVMTRLISAIRVTPPRKQDWSPRDC